MPSNPGIYAWATSEAASRTGNQIRATWFVPPTFACPGGKVVGRWLWKTGSSCNDVNNVGRKTETFVADEFRAVVNAFTPGSWIKPPCTAPPETFISCLDFLVAGTPPGPTPPPVPPAPTTPTCCWSRWGDGNTCGDYNGQGSQCNTDHTKKCSTNSDCHNAATTSVRAIPTTMRAVVGTKGYKGKISDAVSFVSDHPVPSVGDGQILIHVNASSVNPVDWKIVEEPFMGFRLPHVLGFDCSGTVAAVGAGVSRLKVGDEVWADLGKTWLSKGGQLGAYAEYALADESQVGLKPTSLSFSAAASLPLVSLTDLQAYRKMLGAASLVSFANKTVVVTSGSGGTGFVAVQLAKKAYGAKMVITACGPSTQAFCKSLGADVVVDYTAGKAALWDAVAAAGGSDMVFDNYGAAGTADLAMPTLKENGVFLFLPGKGGAVSTHPKKGVHQINFGLADATHYADLDALKGFADKGQLSAHVSQTFPLEKVAEAFEASIAGGAVGKIGVSI